MYALLLHHPTIRLKSSTLVALQSIPFVLATTNNNGRSISSKQLPHGVHCQGSSSFSSSFNFSEQRQQQPEETSRTRCLDPLIVCGPSGVGKGTIIQKYMDELGGKNHFGFSVSHTTRAPRPGEVNGTHYHFVPKEQMEEDIANGKFLEHAQVHGNLYGTSWSAIKTVQNDCGKRCLLDIDVQGVQGIKALENVEQRTLLKPKYVFIAPPSLEVLQQRLIGRGTESAESLSRRTQNAKKELEYGMQAGNFHAIVVNENLEKACQDFALAVKYLYGL